MAIVPRRGTEDGQEFADGVGLSKADGGDDGRATLLQSGLSRLARATGESWLVDWSNFALEARGCVIT